MHLVGRQEQKRRLLTRSQVEERKWGAYWILLQDGWMDQIMFANVETMQSQMTFEVQ